jgi:hypothetical protein
MRYLDLLIAGMLPADGALPHRPLSQNEVDRILSKRKPSSAARSGAANP